MSRSEPHMCSYQGCPRTAEFSCKLNVPIQGSRTRQPVSTFFDQPVCGTHFKLLQAQVQDIFLGDDIRQMIRLALAKDSLLPNFNDAWLSAVRIGSIEYQKFVAEPPTQTRQ